MENLKKILIYFTIISILLLQTFPIFADDFTVGDEDVYQGVSGYKGIQRNISYKDISNSWAKSSIYKLSALGIMNGTNGKFNPRAYMTKRQVLEFIGKTLGIQSSDYVEHLKKENIIPKEEFERIDTLPECTEKKIDNYVKKQVEKNKLSKEEEEKLREAQRDRYTWGKNATREEVAVWIGRALKLTSKNPYMVNGFKDCNKFTEETKYIIEAVLQEGYMSGFSNGYFKPRQAINREQFAKTLDNALDDLLTLRDFKIREGEIYDIKVVATIENHTPAVQTIYYMKNIDGTYPIIYTSKSNKSHLNKGFLVYKNRKLDLSDGLKIEDTIKYYIDEEDNIIYSEFKDIY